MPPECVAEPLADTTNLLGLQIGVEGERDRRSRDGFGDGKVTGPMPESLNVGLQVQWREIVTARNPFGPEHSHHVIASGPIAFFYTDDIDEPADFTVGQIVER